MILGIRVRCSTRSLGLDPEIIGHLPPTDGHHGDDEGGELEAQLEHGVEDHADVRHRVQHSSRDLELVKQARPTGGIGLAKWDGYSGTP